MGSAEFDNYGLVLRQGVSYTEASGRYPSAEESEKKIIHDVVQKLQISSEDRLLDIGCGTGLLLIPISFMVQKAVGVDGADVLKALKKRAGAAEIDYLPGNFMAVENIYGSFDKILCYSVIQNLSSEDEIMRFLRKAVSWLAPGGKLLVGDLSNIDKKKRFQESAYGQEFEKMWAETDGSMSNVDPSQLLPKSQTVLLDDSVILSIANRLRRDGHETFLLPQPVDLPWGHTREDLLITKAR